MQVLNKQPATTGLQAPPARFFSLGLPPWAMPGARSKSTASQASVRSRLGAGLRRRFENPDPRNRS